MSFAIAVLITSMTFLLICTTMLIRNDMVAKYRHKLLDKVSEKSQEDIENGRDFNWRYDAFRAVEYEEMVNKFWKKLDSFYPDKRFIE